MSKSLFLLKTREDYSQDPSYSGSYQIATGMYNSAKFVVDALTAHGREAGLGLLIDGNSIDAAVMAYNPTHVIIEGLWVTPAKFAELMALGRHAGRTWIVRIHSEIPFLSTEGVAIDWIGQYVKLGVKVAANSPRAMKSLKWEAEHTIPPAPENVLYLPNCYPVDDFVNPIPQPHNTMAINIGCFGAFRPLKNQLQQAFAALEFAELIGKPLRFHINSRIDAGGNNAQRNVFGLFGQLDPTTAEVIEHDWEDRETFLQSLSELDILMQVSMSETFNIVAADAVLVGIPIIATDEIPWMYPTGVDPQSVPDIVQKMRIIMNARHFFITKNRIGLRRYNEAAVKKWLNYLSLST